MTVAQAFDVIAASCRVRDEALRILQRKGMDEALKYLERYGGKLEGWERLRELKHKRDLL